MLPENRTNLSSVHGILSFIQSSTRRAYQHIVNEMGENRRPVQNGRSAATTSNLHRDNIRYGTSNLDTSEGTLDDVTGAGAASLRRQIIKLNRRLQHLEEENKERAKREMVMYSITIGFWLLNTWLWFRR
ncbi:hypothetical protein EGK_20420 [Macaca mulatta]|uniref:Mitochondrial fission factor n=2 Tax=Macaca TaxID=9539 RepID=G7NT26_MACMU|nr:hypothetical protein EGK_20420 [Macaca mulatta]EHH60832.1 hypothetical protein EGM_18707 [Macaca fascicularis]